MSVLFLLVSGPIKNRMWEKKSAEALTEPEGLLEDKEWTVGGSLSL